MSYSEPTFNLNCEIWSGPWLSKTFRLATVCNLALGRRMMNQFLDVLVAQSVVGSLQMDLLLPAGTDLRDRWMGFDNDVIEVPTGSGRWYGLLAFDDAGKGFSNEYRIAVIGKIGQAVGAQYAGLDWPDPVP